MISEGREFPRVEIHMRGQARKLSSPLEPPLFDDDAPRTDVLASINYSGGALTGELLQFLVGLEKKLDSLIGMLTHEKVKDDFPLNIETLEIGGQGLKFHSKERFEEGEYLELLLNLSIFPFRIIGGMGKISATETDEIKLTKEGLNIYNFAFTRISDHAVEALIRFIFQMQREMLRLKKEGDR